MLAPLIVAVLGALSGPAAPFAVSSPVRVPAAPRAADPEPLKADIQTSDRLELKATFLRPKDDGERAPAALLVHDAGGDRKQLGELAERLWKSGFGVLLLDLRGHGESAKPDLDWAKMSEAEQEKLWAFATRDVQAAAEWLRQRPEVHTTNLTVVGLRAGSALAVRHSARDENVRALVLLAPPTKKYGFDLESDMQDLAGLPTLIFSSRQLQDTAETIQARAHEASGGVSFVELSITRRSDDVLGDSRMPSDIARWMQEKCFPKRGR